jgi:hypothetical protein
MNLLHQIRDLATDSSAKLSDVLRKAKVLAVRLGNQAFKQWVDRELNGYQSSDELPAYRTIRVASYGNFSGPFDSGLSGAPIPTGCLPEKFREFSTTMQLVDAVSYYEDLVSTSVADAKNEIRASWPADLVALVGGQIYVDMNCISAWRSVPRGAIVALVDTVRNRILDFVLEMEAAAPDAGEAKPGTKPVADEKVGEIFNTYVVSGNTVVGGTVAHVQQTQVAKGDLSSLKTHLLSLGVERNDLRALEKAIKGDPRPKEPGKFGKGVSAWIGRMVAKAASGAWSIPTRAAADVLSRLLYSYYGLS